MFCSKCGKEVDLSDSFCSSCGNMFDNKNSFKEEPRNDFSKRVLCSDGSCIGVIGEDGFCKECKKPYQENNEANDFDKKVESFEQEIQKINKVEQKKSSRNLLLFFLAAIFILGYWGPNNNSENSKQPISSATTTMTPSKIEAWVMTKKFVKKRLKSPSTASFGGVLSDYQNPDKVVTYLSNSKFRVRAWVDSQNAFGATIRTRFVCELEHLGGDRWQLTQFEFME